MRHCLTYVICALIASLIFVGGVILGTALGSRSMSVDYIPRKVTIVFDDPDMIPLVSKEGVLLRWEGLGEFIRHTHQAGVSNGNWKSDAWEDPIVGDGNVLDAEENGSN